MRKVLCLTIGMLLSFAASASAQTYQWRVKLSVADLYIRTAPNGFMIGTLYGGDSFRWKRTDNGYFYGFCGGTAQRCAWLGSAYMEPGGSAQTTCSGNGSTAVGLEARHYLIDNYAKCVNDYVPGKWYLGGDTGNRTKIVPGLTAHLYGNYRNGTFYHQITTTALDSSAIIDWRWVSDNGEAVVVKLKDGPWAYMRRDKLPTTLLYKDGVYRTDYQGSGG